jgi:valyl-tRNA synthetase
MEFAWSDLCDWYLEMAKIELRDPERAAGARRVWQTGLEVLTDTMRLLHPVMPFVTEEIWAALPAAGPRDQNADKRPLLISAPWPVAGTRDRKAEAAFDALAEVIRAARNLRTEAGLPGAKTVSLHIAPSSADAATAIEAGRRYLEPLARVRSEIAASGAMAPTGATATALGAIWLGAEAAGEPVPGQRDRIEELRRNRDRVQTLLADPAFTGRAPAAVVQRERDRLADLEERLRQVGGSVGPG